MEDEVDIAGRLIGLIGFAVLVPPAIFVIGFGTGFAGFATGLSAGERLFHDGSVWFFVWGALLFVRPVRVGVAGSLLAAVAGFLVFVGSKAALRGTLSLPSYGYEPMAWVLGLTATAMVVVFLYRRASDAKEREGMRVDPKRWK